jgi:hypothetical protein
MIVTEMLPAERGDSILIEYGEGATVTNRVLIDGGPVNSGLYAGVRDRLLQVPVSPDQRRHFDLLVMTHVDSDHVEGVIRLLQDDELACVFDDVWFNGWKHIEPLEPGATVSVLGPTQGEFLGALLSKQGRPWNQYFKGGAIFTDGPKLPECKLRGGMILTLLSPTIEELKKLAREWDIAVKNAGFDPGDAEEALAQLSGKWWARPPVLGDEDRIRASADTSEANGSSIAFLAEFGGRSLLLTGDAHDDVMTAAIRKLRVQRELDKPLRLDAFKLSHHGSEHNTTSQLLAEIAADHYLVSTNGNRFDHPNALTIREAIDHHNGANTPILCFNYDQPQTTIWRNAQGIEVRYGDDATVCFDCT